MNREDLENPAPVMESKTSDFTLSRATKAAWLKALRSGRYKQTKHHLHDEYGYCCLGVLCRVLGVPTAKLDGNVAPLDIGLFQPVLDWKVTVDGQRVSLMDLNDGELVSDVEPKSFREIADIIEASVPCHD